MPQPMFPFFDKLGQDKNVLKGIVATLIDKDDWFLADKVFQVANTEEDQVYAGNILANAPDAFYGEYDKKHYVNWGDDAIPLAGAQVDTIPYQTNKYFYSLPQPKEIVRIWDAQGVDGMARALQPVLSQVKIMREADLASLLSTTDNWLSANNKSASNKWTTANGTPVQDVMYVIEKVSKFRDPDTMVISSDAAYALMSSSAFNSPRPMDIDRATLTKDQLAELLKARFALKNVFIGRTHYNSAAKGKSANITPLYTGFAWIGCTGLDDVAPFSKGGQIASGTVAALRVMAEDMYVEMGWKQESDSYLFTCSHQDVTKIVFNQLGGVLSNLT